MDGGAWWAAVHGVAKSRTGLSDVTFTFRFRALEKEMATHPSVLAWRIPGMEEPGGLPSMGWHRVGHDWSDLAAAAGIIHYKGSQSSLRPRELPSLQRSYCQSLTHGGAVEQDSCCVQGRLLTASFFLAGTLIWTAWLQYNSFSSFPDFQQLFSKVVTE